MDLHRLTQLIESGNIQAVESAWLEAMEADTPPEHYTAVLTQLVEAGHAEAAETCATMLMSEKPDEMDPSDALDLAKAVFAGCPDSQTVRDKTAEMYRRVHSEHEHFDELLSAAGITSNQSPRRSLRTMDTCLAIQPGSFLVNRFDNKALQAKGFDDVMEEFELTDSAGRAVNFEPKLLADEFDLTDPADFRVLTQLRKGELPDVLESEPVKVLIGLCMTHGGAVDADQIKQTLVPKYLDAKKWSGWWNRARSAARKSELLTMDGRPVVVTYHPHGRSLEEELAPAVKKARVPAELLDVLRTYEREVRHRHVEIDQEFVKSIANALAKQADKYRKRRPADALTASLGLAELAQTDLPAPDGEYPAPAELLAGTDNPGRAVAELDDASLWPVAIQAVAQSDQAAELLSSFFARVPAGLLDGLRDRLDELGQAGTVDRIVVEALANPSDYVEVLCWLWEGPARPVADVPNNVELLGRILRMLQEVDRDQAMDSERRRLTALRVRNALSAGDYARYRQTVIEMDEGVAAAMRRLIDRTDGLAETVRGDMLQLLREHHWRIFVEQKVEPWNDEKVIYSSQPAIDRRQAELKEIVDIRMPENARAIGAAAALGDLRENAEYKFAQEEKERLLQMASELRADLTKSRPIEPDNVDTSRVTIGTTITVRRASDQSTLELTFLGPWEADLPNRVYSYRSGLAREFLGVKPGEQISATIEDKPDEFTVEAIRAAAI